VSSLQLVIKPGPLAIVLATLGLERLNPLLNRPFAHVQTVLDKAVDDVIYKAQQQKQENGSSSNNSKSLLHLLLNAKDGQVNKAALKHEELRDEVKTFLVAGHETTATWCYWACFALAKFPDVQEKVYQDVQTHCPPDTDELLRLDRVEKMDYLHAFLQEVLRMYPPVGIMWRFNANEETNWGETSIPSSTRLVMSPFLLHRHPKYWPHRPNVFYPERWLGKEDAIAGGRLHHFAFMPFGAGGRSCIGQRFAVTEAKLIMATLVRNLAVEIAPSQRDVDFTFSAMGTMKSKPILKICAKARTG